MDLEQIKRLRDGGCACCGRPVMIDAMQFRIVTQTESGQIIFPYDNDDEAIGVMLPVCSYHMALVGDGWVVYHDIMKIPVQSKIITKLETMTDGQLRLEQVRLRRLPRNDMNNMLADAIKAVQAAREMSKGDVE